MEVQNQGMALKKKHSFRLVGEVETGSHGGEDVWQGGSWRAGQVRLQLAEEVVPHLCEDKPRGTAGERDRPCNPGFQGWDINPQNLWLENPIGVESLGETPNLTGEFVREIHRVLECTQIHLPRNQHQKGPICLWVVGEVTESWLRAQQAAFFPLSPLPHIQCHNTVKWVVLP